MSSYDTDSITLLLPLPPSGNSYYSYTSPVKHKVIKYICAEGKIFREKVNKYVKENNFNIQANVRLRVEVILSYPTKRAQDLDNRMKALLDALTHAEVWLDDSLIDDLRIIRGPIQKPGVCIVKIQESKQKIIEKIINFIKKSLL